MIALSKNALALTGNFNSPAAIVTRRAPSSPMVVQSLVEAIANLTEQVNALAVRQARQPQIIHVPAALPARPVKSRESDFDYDSSQQDTKVKRSSLLDFFD